MTPNRRKEIEERAISTYGGASQTDMCIEEMSKLTKAICKHRRACKNADGYDETHDSIIEEIADVQITLDQMRIIFGSSADQEEFKLNRLWARMEEMNEN